MTSSTTPTNSDRTTLLAHILDLEARIRPVLQGIPGSGWLRLDMTVPQLKTLIVLHGIGTLRMSTLSETLRVSVSTMTGIIDRLVERGLVERTVDPADRRSVLVRLTASGQNQVAALYLLGRKQLAAILEYVSTEDLAVVARAMDILHAAFMEMYARSSTAMTENTPPLQQSEAAAG